MTDYPTVPVDDLLPGHIYSILLDAGEQQRWMSLEFLGMHACKLHHILWLEFRFRVPGTPWDNVRLTIDAKEAKIRRSIHELDLFDEMTP